MIQRFIELGEGYSDIYELLEIVKSNKHRLAHLIMLRTVKEDRQVASFVAVLHPTAEGNFQPLYVCREGIVLKQNDSKRVELFKRAAEEAEKKLWYSVSNHLLHFQKQHSTISTLLAFCE